MPGPCLNTSPVAAAGCGLSSPAGLRSRSCSARPALSPALARSHKGWAGSPSSAPAPAGMGGGQRTGSTGKGTKGTVHSPQAPRVLVLAVAGAECGRGVRCRKVLAVGRFGSVPLGQSPPPRQIAAASTAGVSLCNTLEIVDVVILKHLTHSESVSDLVFYGCLWSPKHSFPGGSSS